MFEREVYLGFYIQICELNFLSLENINLQDSDHICASVTSLLCLHLSLSLSLSLSLTHTHTHTSVTFNSRGGKHQWSVRSIIHGMFCLFVVYFCSILGHRKSNPKKLTVPNFSSALSAKELG